MNGYICASMIQMKATINTEIRFLYGKLEQELFGQFLRMQLDLQSHGAFAPKILEIGLPRLRLMGSFLQDLDREMSPASPGAHWQVSPPALFRSNWVKHDYTFPDWIGKNEKTFVSSQ